MNTKVLLEIANGARKIDNNVFVCRLDSKEGEISPIGLYAKENPEICKKIQQKYEIKYHITVAQLLAKKRSRIKTEYNFNTTDLAHYLDISYSQTLFLFNCFCRSKKEFIEMLTGFAKNEIDIRECEYDECGIPYVCFPDDIGCVCDNCREILLDMLGMR